MSVSLVLFSILIGLVGLAYYFLHRRFSYWKEQGIPHDPPNYLMGSFKGKMNASCFKDVIEYSYKKYKGTGPFCGFYLFQKAGVLLLDKSLIKQVLIKEFSKFTDRGFYVNEVDDPLSAHLFQLDGSKWRRMRNKLSPTFTSGKMKIMFPTLMNVNKELIKVVNEMIEKDNVIDFKDIMGRFTTDVIGTCAFGLECNSLRDPRAEFMTMGRKAIKDIRGGFAAVAFASGFPTLARKLHMRLTTDEVQDFFMGIVRETLAYRDANKIERGDFLNILMELRKDQKDGYDALTVEEIAAQSFVFFVAGFETSSTTLGFALYELALHQEIQNKLRKEVQETFKKSNNEFTYENIKSMQYLDQVISETSRKYTIVVNLNRLALEDYEVPGHPNYVIKKGMPVIIPSLGIHMDPEFYPDPEKFDPDRFTPDKVAERDSVEYLPFGDGPRNCVGMRFGQMQVRVGLATILNNFRISVAKETEIPLQFDPESFLQNAKGGIKLKAERL